jgi:REP element-mobilizing transposase RayT
LLSKVVRAFKEAVTKTVLNQFQANEFGWQRSFYDHIIRNDIALQNIRLYIRQNPLKWELDKDNPENLYM